jgi:hypothetical protein
MSTKIKTWQIVNSKLEYIDTTLQSSGRTEPYDLEPWIESNPEILSDSIMLIGKQVITKSGKIDLLGIDRLGNTVIIELKRDALPREVIAQAIDYASDVSQWSSEKLGEICSKYLNKALEDAFNDKFPEVDIESINVNGTQRILLVGFSIESSLERMIEWLSETYNVSINAIILSYVRTKNGDELLTKTSIISEEVIEERIKTSKFKIAKSDQPGSYDNDELRSHLVKYLSDKKITSQRMKNILLPALLKSESLTREQVIQAFAEAGNEVAKIGYYISLISNQLDMEKNSFLRQVISYGYPNRAWEKDNYAIKPEYKDLVTEVLSELQ